MSGGIVGEAVTGAIGIGNPVGDACNAVTDGAVEAITSPITGAVEGLGNDIFGQITDWVSGGASWLIGQVVRLSDETTTPDLTTQGFIAQYRKMAAIAVFLALAMLVFAVLESLGQGAGLLRVVLVNLPLALIASSVAFVVVQMLITATDGISHAVAVSTEKNSQHFFHSAIEGLGGAGGKAGSVIDNPVGGNPVSGAVGHAVGSVEVPLFVVLLAAIIGAFAAFFVWVELLMRDAAIYVVALFAPMALAASIWPRWSGALRRTAELLCVIIASKFVIVSIIGLAAGLADESGGKVEHVLAAAALMLLACFAPFVLFKLVPFAEGALAAGYGRHSAAGGAAGGAHLATSAMVMRNTARSRWSGGGGGSGEGGGKKGGAGEAPVFKRSGGGGGEAAAAEAGPAAPVAAAAKAPVAAERAGRKAAGRLGESATAQSAGGGGGAESSPSAEPPSQRSGSGPPPPTQGEPSTQAAWSASESARRSGGGQASDPLGGQAESPGSEAPRPAPERSRGKSDEGERK